MHFLGDELVRLLEEDLPRHFGGGPTSYQLEEREAETGRTRVLIVASPGVGPIDEAALVDAALGVLASGGPAQKMMADVWRRAGTVGVVRREPTTTAAGKVPSLVRSVS
jgi:hypothetical protein